MLRCEHHQRPGGWPPADIDELRNAGEDQVVEPVGTPVAVLAVAVQGDQHRALGTGVAVAGRKVLVVAHGGVRRTQRPRRQVTGRLAPEERCDDLAASPSSKAGCRPAILDPEEGERAVRQVDGVAERLVSSVAKTTAPDESVTVEGRPGLERELVDGPPTRLAVTSLASALADTVNDLPSVVVQTSVKS